MAKLVCQAGPHAGHEYALRDGRTVFGRQSTCDAQVLDKMASREHFAVRNDRGLFTLVDLESRNGTRLNGRKVTERQLDFGDTISVGDVEWVFVKEEGDVELRDLLTTKYDVIEKVGEGGMGIVYKATQRSMDRIVALKILAPKYAARRALSNTLCKKPEPLDASIIRTLSKCTMSMLRTGCTISQWNSSMAAVPWRFSATRGQCPLIRLSRSPG